MSLQPPRPYLQALFDTLAKLDADPLPTSQSLELKRILRHRISDLQHTVAPSRFDSLRNQFQSDLHGSSLTH